MKVGDLAIYGGLFFIVITFFAGVKLLLRDWP